MRYSLKTFGMVAGFSLLFAVAYTLVGPNAHASAEVHGSGIVSTGRWTSAGAQVGDSIPSGVNSAAEFKTYISNLLYGRTVYSIPGSAYNEYGAAFLVETMLHGRHDYAANSSLVSAARSDYGTWAEYVDDYAAAGKVNWGYSTTIGSGSLNTMHECRNGPGGYCWDRAVYQNNNYNSGGWDAHQFHYYTMDSSERSTLIIFYNPDGTRFQIRKECGNVIGQTSPLNPTPPKLQGYKITNTGSPSGPFSADRVNALHGPSYGYYHGNTAQPFFFTGSVQLVAGSWKVSVTDYAPADGAWKYIGYQVCLSGDARCSLDGHTGVRSPNTAFSMSNFNTYNIRIIYKQDTCPAGTTGTPPNCIDISGNCPQDAKINASELVNVNLPDQTPSPQAAPPTYTRSRGATYTQYAPSAKTTVSSVADISPGGSRVSIPHSNDKYQQTTLNYHNYVTTYPNDQNQASVTYRSYYVIRTYRAATTPSYYDCDYGGSASGSTCTYDPCGGATRSHSGLCYYAVGGYTSKTCPYTWYSTIGCAYHTSAYCSYGSLSYTSSYNRCSYTGAPEYKYSLISTSGEQSVSNTVDAYQMQACYFRDFQVTSVSPAANFLPYGELENPTGVSASATGQVRFYVTHGVGLRQPYKVNGDDYDLNYTGACTDSDSGGLNATGGTARTETDSWSASGDPSCTNMTPSPPIIGTTGCAAYEFGQSSGKVNIAGDIQSYSGGAVSGSACTPKIENRPYLKVFGGDVLAGAGFTAGATCTSPGNGQILGWNKGDDDYTHGSGTEFAAYAISHIKEFASAQGGGVTAADPPSGLAFANSPIGGGDYGGNLTGTGCIPDYYSQRSGNNLPNLDVSTLTQHTYSTPGSIGTSGANGLHGTVKSGEQVTVYVNGNVYISGNINYATAAAIQDMPSFTVVASGNIYISGNVTHLDGNYIAQNSKIYDCASANNTPYAQSAIYSACKNKLTVNGSFVSKQTLFLRTGDNASLRFSDGDAGPGSNNASEEFDYTPSLWLAPPSGNSQPPAYDAITSLPPVL